ncbi:type II secretion system minor pseudopilin GspI [Pseudomonas akapageensis]|uniref:type II secretion system minor pseudopilin GspI n=1 Tax=Pseudomonas akapageensis TaxID=2609961 RepID=UPI0014097322|nr:type II secretion system minor pseudopilin GspI [Pseudomonas akapageensis]
MSNERGFTLLEVLVALAVFALLASAAATASGHVLGQSGGLQDRLFGAWLADNHIAELSLQPPSAPGQRQLALVMDGRDWTLLETIESASEPGLLQVEIRVGRNTDDDIVHLTTTWLEAADVAR